MAPDRPTADEISWSIAAADASRSLLFVWLPSAACRTVPTLNLLLEGTAEYSEQTRGRQSPLVPRPGQFANCPGLGHVPDFGLERLPICYCCGVVLPDVVLARGARV